MAAVVRYLASKDEYEPGTQWFTKGQGEWPEKPCEFQKRPNLINMVEIWGLFLENIWKLNLG